MIEKECPLNRDYYCNDRCKWFDEEDQDCRIFWYIGAIVKIIKEAVEYRDGS